MSAFIWFYILAPIVMKYVISWKRAIAFIPVSLGTWLIWKLLIGVTFGGINTLDNINMLTGASPFGSMIYFALGILTFFAIKEKRVTLTTVGLIIFALLGVVIHRYAWTVAAVASILIIFYEQYPVTLQGRFKCIVQFFGKHSFNIYLVHLLAFEISWTVVSSIFTTNVLYISWMLLAIVLIILLVWVLDFITDKVLLLCKS